MCDKELLKWAAKAFGAEINGYRGETPLYAVEVQVSENYFEYTPWNPLEDDGDALRLSVNLDMQITINRVDGFVEVIAGYNGQHRIRESLAGCLYTATRRAIVRAAAEIGRTLK